MTVKARERVKRRNSWPDTDLAMLHRLWPVSTITKIAKIMGRSKGSISGQAMRSHLHFEAKPKVLAHDHPAMTGARTIFTGSVRRPDQDIGVLKPGAHQRKLGPRVLKGPWKGMPIYSLTLEERATCPDDCALLANCYGNHMGRSIRYRHGSELEGQIGLELVELQHKYPGGFVIRLHVLGDFYSLAYVQFWRRALATFPALRVFGYTARGRNDAIGREIAALRDQQWDRFAIRTSGAMRGPRTLVMESKDTELLKNADRIICPAQTGATLCCATCALCWSGTVRNRPIAFLAH